MSKKKRIIEIIKDEKAEVKEAPKPSEVNRARKTLLMAYRDQNPLKFNSKGFNKELTKLG